jgi:hypothetical protein
MNRTSEKKYAPLSHLMLLFLVLSGILALPAAGLCETYGIKDDQGIFLPKVTVTVTGKDLIIKKTDPQDKFRSFSLTLNRKNSNLIRNVGLISMEWIDATNKPTKPVLFAGPLYNAATRVFQDSLTKSLGIKLIDKTKLNLFAGKSVSDLFTIQVDDQALLSSETVTEKDRTVPLGPGRDVSLNVDKTSVVFNESNFKKGEIVTVENRAGLDQVLGVELPEKGLFFNQIRRKPDQTKIDRENWDRFTLAADSGIFIVLIPDSDPAQLAQLDGKDIVIKVFQGTKVRETRKIPIKISSELRTTARDTSPEPTPDKPKRPSVSDNKPEPTPKPEQATTGNTTRKDIQKTSPWLWALQIFNLVMLAGLGVYTIFFMLPKLQVLGDRLAKNEMFIHGSREALREEFDQLKEEVSQQSERKVASE